MTDRPDAPIEATVSLRREDDDTIVIGRGLVAPAGIAQVPVVGGTLFVDPMAPTTAWQIRVTDLEVAAETVAVLAGEQVADALQRADSDTVEVPLAKSAERDRLAHRAMLSWLDATTPLPLDSRVLALEALLIDVDLADLVSVDRSTDELLVEWLPTLVAWSQRSHAADSPMGQVPDFLGLLSDALPEALAALDLGPLSTLSPRLRPLIAQAVHEAELLGLRERLGLHHLDPDAALAALEVLRPQPAGALGAPTPTLVQGVCPVDWARVPRGSVSTAEEGVSWQLALGVQPRLSVVVSAPLADPSCAILDTADRPPPIAPHLQATIVHPDWPVPLAVVDLAARGEAMAWLGSAQLGRNVIERLEHLGVDGVVVDVHAAGLVRRPRLGAERWVAAATRWAARGVSGVRVAAAYEQDPQGSLYASAASAFTMAARLFRASAVGRFAASAADCERAAATLAIGTNGRRGVPMWQPAGSPLPAPLGGGIDLAPSLSVAEAWYAVHLPAAT